MAFFSNLPIWVVGSCAFFWRHQRKNFLGGNFEGAQNWIVWMEIDFVGLAFWTFFVQSCEVWGQFVLQLLGMVHNSSLASPTVNCNHLLRRSLRPNIWQVGIPKYSNVLKKVTNIIIYIWPSNEPQMNILEPSNDPKVHPKMAPKWPPKWTPKMNSKNGTSNDSDRTSNWP